MVERAVETGAIGEHVREEVLVAAECRPHLERLRAHAARARVVPQEDDALRRAAQRGRASQVVVAAQ